MSQVLSWKELEDQLQSLRKHKKIVFTNGCFDILHVGHVRYLQQAKALGDLLVVALNTDSSVQKLKGATRPIQNEADRCEILAQLKAVDMVTVFDQPTPLDIIKIVKPHFLVKGGDWPPEKIVGYDFVKSYGGKVLSLNFIDGKSTTQIIEKSQIKKQT